MKMRTRIDRYLLTGALATIFVGRAHAQADPEKILPPTVEGSWVRTDTNASGSFDNLTSKFAPAQLTPKGKEMLEKLPQFARFQQRIVNGILVTNPTPCIYNGGQLTLDVDSEGFMAIKSKDEIVQVQDRGADRHIYLTRKTIPDSSVRNPSNSGYSIGQIEPDGTLDVTVSNFAPGRVVAGGYRGNKTVLKESFVPDPDGEHLKLTMTWNDPEFYVEPHTYFYTFERTPKDFTARDEYCDATNPLEGQSVAGPQN